MVGGRELGTLLVGLAALGALVTLHGEDRATAGAHAPAADDGDRRPASGARLRGVGRPRRALPQRDALDEPHGIEVAHDVVLGPTPPAEHLTTAELIADLAHDQRAHNACRALEVLRTRPGVDDDLRAALASADYQQRQLAALALARRAAEPEHLLLAVLCEGLARDGTDPSRFSGYSTLGDRAGYLDAHREVAAPYLLDTLATSDRQARFVAALCLAWHADPPEPEACFAELAAHLADDDVRGNATFARDALVLLHPHAGDAWIAWYSRLDVQGRGFLDEVLLRHERGDAKALRRYGLPSYQLNAFDDRIPPRR